MKTISLTVELESAYEDFLSKQSGAMIYYSLKFRSFLEKQTKAYSKYLVAVDDSDNIWGILPLFYKEGPLGTVINSLPYYGSNGGILSESKEAEEVLLQAYEKILLEDRIASATLIENPLNKDYSYSGIKCDEHDYRIGQLTNISGEYCDLEDLMVKFDSKTRNSIRKAIKSNVEVEIDNNKFHFLENVHLDNMNSIGGMAKKPIFFRNIRKIFQADIDYNIYIAKIDGDLVAAMLVLYYGQVVEYYTPVIVKEYRPFQPLSLIIAKAMLDANKRGHQWWNWGGTWATQNGVYDFKSKWGTIDINYNYYISILDKKLYSASRDDLLEHYSGFYVLPFKSLKS